MRGRLLLCTALGLQRLDKLYRVDNGVAIRAGGGGGKQIPHDLIAGQGGVHLPAQRHDPGAVGDAPAQAALSVVGVAELPGGVFLGCCAVRAGESKCIFCKHRGTVLARKAEILDGIVFYQ